MGNSIERSSEVSALEPEAFHYSSIVLQRFVETIEQRPEGQLLDVGPVCQANISFFSQRIHRLYICDMFRRIDQDRRADLPPSHYWRHLDYPSKCFDGILLWDLVDYLDEVDVKMLVERCRNMIKSGGMIMLYAMGKKVVPAVRNTFIIEDDFQLILRPLDLSDLPLHHRQNRDILYLLRPFNPIKTLIYRSGIREFLFQHD